jgi:hypothetical protein
MVDKRLDAGCPCIIEDATELESYGIEKGDKGWVNSRFDVPSDGTYIFFIKRGERGMLVIKADRVSVDEDLFGKGVELDKDTINLANVGD